MIVQIDRIVHCTVQRHNVQKFRIFKGKNATAEKEETKIETKLG